MIGSNIGGVHESVNLVGGGVTADLEHDTDWNDLLQRATDLDPADFRPRTLAFSRGRFIEPAARIRRLRDSSAARPATAPPPNPAAPAAAASAGSTTAAPAELTRRNRRHLR